MPHLVAANAVVAALLALAGPGATVAGAAAIGAAVAANAVLTNAVVAAEGDLLLDPDGQGRDRHGRPLGVEYLFAGRRPCNPSSRCRRCSRQRRSFFSVSFEDAKEMSFEEISSSSSKEVVFSSSFVDKKEIFFSVSFEDAKEISFFSLESSKKVLEGGEGDLFLLERGEGDLCGQE